MTKRSMSTRSVCCCCLGWLGKVTRTGHWVRSILDEHMTTTDVKSFKCNTLKDNQHQLLTYHLNWCVLLFPWKVTMPRCVTPRYIWCPSRSWQQHQYHTLKSMSCMNCSAIMRQPAALSLLVHTSRWSRVVYWISGQYSQANVRMRPNRLLPK